MNLLKKLIIGALTLIVLAGPAGQENKKEYEKLSRDYTKIERTINFDNPQETLNEAFKRCSPNNISEIIYDHDFTHSDNYIKNRFIGHSRRLIEGYLNQARKGTEGHILCVTGIFEDTGNNKKRTVFARKSLLTSLGVNCEADLDSAIYHEDIHAEEERYGYEFGDRRIGGEELMKMFNENKLRTEVISGAGEFDAYASELERANNVKTKPSAMHVFNTTLNAYQVYSILERALERGTLTPLEIKYAEAKLKKHENTIETLKNYR